MATATEEKVWMYFKVLLGGHTERNADGVEVEYGPGDVFASTVDRAKQFGTNKFEKLEEIPRSVQSQIAKTNTAKAIEEGKSSDEMELEEMTRADLVKMCNDLELKVPPGANKNELVSIIKDKLDTA